MGRILRYYFMAMAGLAGLYYLNHHSMTIASAGDDSTSSSQRSRRVSRNEGGAKKQPSVSSQSQEAAASESNESLLKKIDELSARLAKAEAEVHNLREERSTASVSAKPSEAEPASTKKLSLREERKLREQEAAERAKVYSVTFAEKPGDHDLGLLMDSAGAVPQEVLWQSGAFNSDRSVDARRITFQIVEKVPGKPSEYKKLDKYCKNAGSDLSGYDTRDLAGKEIALHVEGIDHVDARCSRR